MKKILFLLSLTIYCFTLSSCSNEPAKEAEETEEEFDLEALQKSDQEKMDSVEKYWKDKMNKN